MRGTAQAKSHPLVAKENYQVPDESRPGVYDSQPPLAAVRSIGRGRLAVFGWSPIQTFFNYGHYMAEDIYFTRGGDGKPSDGPRFLEQTLRWLAEPSLTDPQRRLGG